MASALRQGFFTILIIVLFSSLTGCGQSQDPLRIGTNVWPGYEPLYLAQHLQAWNKADVSLIEYPSASEVLRAFRNHNLDAASLTLDEALRLQHDNIPIQIVLVHDVSQGADSILAPANIKSFRDLRNKRIGVESGALGAYMLTRALEINQMSFLDIKIHSLDVNQHERAFLAGEVDAVITFEPVRTRLIKAGAHEIFTSREIPNEIVDVMVVHKKYLQDHPARVRTLLHGWFRAIKYLQTNEPAAVVILSQHLKIAPQEVLASYEGLHIPKREENLQLLSNSNSSLLPALQRLNKVMVKNRLLAREVSIDQLLNNSYLPDSED